MTVMMTMICVNKCAMNDKWNDAASFSYSTDDEDDDDAAADYADDGELEYCDEMSREIR